MIRRVLIALFLAACVGAPALAHDAQQYDVVVIGAAPGGIGAALSAAKLGHTVALVEYRAHVGGMSASGLGKSDITKLGAIGGLWDEFVGRVLAYYTQTYGADSDQVAKCINGYFYEPSVAERIFNEMLAEQSSIRVLLRHRLDEVVRAGKTVTAVRVTNRDSSETLELRGKVFIDATYEGDLAAYSGVRYRLGREGRDEFNEAHAGVIYMDHTTRSLLPGTTGQGDDRLVAYTYRLCFTTDPANSVYPEMPPNYDRTRYLNYLLDLKLGRIDTVVKAFSIHEIPNQKYDVNMKPWPLGFPFAEECQDYPEATWEERERIEEHMKNLTLGLMYFVQNDPEVPEANRAEARRYGLPKDEFTDNGHFPWQLYVREARRIVGEYTLTENDLTFAPESHRAPVHADAVSAGEFPIDSFPTRKYEPGHETALEGYILMLNRYTQPYQIPYRVMIPQEVDGLIVPVAASTTHIAFSSVRLEPTWMSLGQAAGAAAHLAIEQGKQPRAVPVETLQRMLVGQGQVLTFFEDLPKDHPAFRAFQYLGTKGLFTDYQARPDEPLTRAEAAHWLACAAKVCGVTPPDLSGDGGAPLDAAAWNRAVEELRGRTAASADAAGKAASGAVTRAAACVALDKLLAAAGH
jgi:hypothetical protein